MRRIRRLPAQRPAPAGRAAGCQHRRVRARLGPARPAARRLPDQAHLRQEAEEGLGAVRSYHVSCTPVLLEGHQFEDHDIQTIGI